MTLPDTVEVLTKSVVKTPDQVRILNEVNRIKSDATTLTSSRSEQEIWLQGLLSASFCNRCKSSNPFNLMRQSLEESSGSSHFGGDVSGAGSSNKKSPTDIYIDDVPKSKESVFKQLTLEFQRSCLDEQRRGKYDVDKSALQINFQTTPLDESVEIVSQFMQGAQCR